MQHKILVRQIKSGLLGLACITGTMGSVWAQATSELKLEEVIVTAERRATSLQDVPISLTVFTDQEIERNMFKGVNDYLVRVPNVSFISSGARDRKDLSIRGVSNLLTTDSSKRVDTFGFYIDEFNVALGTTNPQIMDLEQIEVLRGPQGTYFGRNAIGGALNITMKKPDSKAFYAEAKGGYARFDTWDVEGILNVPLIADTLAIRVNAKHTESEGNIRNINPIGGGNTKDYDYGRFSLRYTPTERLLIDLTASYTDEVGGMREGVPSGVPTQFSQNLVGAPLGIIPFVPLEDGVGFYPNNRNRVNFNRPQKVGAKFHYITGRIQYDFDSFSLISVTGMIDSEQILEGDIDGGSLDLYYETKPIDRDSFSQEFRLQSTGDGPIDWTVGGMIGRDEGASNQYTYVGAARPFGLPEGYYFSPTIEKSEADSAAVFGEIKWHATDRLDLIFGVRYTDENLTFDSLNPGDIVIDGEEASFDAWTPKVAATYMLNDEWTAYATISNGFKSGGVQVSTGFQVGSYEPEDLWNYEVGFKAELLNGQVRWDTSFYYMDWSDLQAQFAQYIIQPNNDVFLITGIQNAAEARTYGFETEVKALINENWTATAGVGYLNARFEDFEGAFIDNMVYDLSGSVLPNSPEWTANADLEYHRPISDTVEGFIRAEWFYRDDIKPSLQSLAYEGFPWDVPSFNAVNLRFGVESERYAVIAYVENLFDENYFTNSYEKVFMGGMYVEPSYQTYGIRVTLRTN